MRSLLGRGRVFIVGSLKYRVFRVYKYRIYQEFRGLSYSLDSTSTAFVYLIVASMGS